MNRNHRVAVRWFTSKSNSGQHSPHSAAAVLPSSTTTTLPSRSKNLQRFKLQRSSSSSLRHRPPAEAIGLPRLQLDPPFTRVDGEAEYVERYSRTDPSTPPPPFHYCCRRCHSPLFAISHLVQSPIGSEEGGEGEDETLWRVVSRHPSGWPTFRDCEKVTAAPSAEESALWIKSVSQRSAVHRGSTVEPTRATKATAKTSPADTLDLSEYLSPTSLASRGLPIEGDLIRRRSQAVRSLYQDPHAPSKDTVNHTKNRLSWAESSVRDENRKSNAFFLEAYCRVCAMGFEEGETGVLFPIARVVIRKASRSSPPSVVYTAAPSQLILLPSSAVCGDVDGDTREEEEDKQ